MNYMNRRRRSRQRRTIFYCLKKAIGYLVWVALLVTILALNVFAIINWLTGCCVPGGACIPETIYPQCESIHKEVPYGEGF